MRRDRHILYLTWDLVFTINRVAYGGELRHFVMLDIAPYCSVALHMSFNCGLLVHGLSSEDITTEEQDDHDKTLENAGAPQRRRWAKDWDSWICFLS